MVASEPGQSRARAPFTAGDSLDPAEFAQVRRTSSLDHCKWDPQVGDQATLAPYPIFIGEAAWTEVADSALALASEALAAERELLQRTELHRPLGLPGSLRRAFSRATESAESPSFARTMRFDFHFTRDGWRVSEVNSDVPGGFAEAEGFAGLMARYFPNSRVAGRPASLWADRVAATLASEGTVALLSAPGYMEDAQVVAYLASLLRARGFSTRLIGPAELGWASGRAFLSHSNTPLAAIVRFYQLEWLSRLALESGWQYFLFGGVTPVGNAGRAALTESKRFPLIWPYLRAKLTNFSRLMPEAREPREAALSEPDSWVLKAGYSNCGDSVVAREWVSRSRWRSVWAGALLNPRAWVAQRRFDVLPIDTPAGPLTHCLGVYVIDGQVAGAYLRLSKKGFVDSTAVDAALLVVRDP
jgi:glutathionylspermidine synthase